MKKFIIHVEANLADQQFEEYQAYMVEKANLQELAQEFLDSSFEDYDEVEITLALDTIQVTVKK